MEQPKIVGLDQYPRAAAAVRRSKGWGGLLGFLVGLLGAWMHGGTLPHALMVAVAASLCGRVVAWAAAIAVWRHLIRAHARTVIARAANRRHTPERS